MNMISEQVKELRKYAGFFKGDRIDGNLSCIFREAANTIESLYKAGSGKYRGWHKNKSTKRRQYCTTF